MPNHTAYTRVERETVVAPRLPSAGCLFDSDPDIRHAARCALVATMLYAASLNHFCAPRE